MILQTATKAGFKSNKWRFASYGDTAAECFSRLATSPEWLQIMSHGLKKGRVVYIRIIQKGIKPSNILLSVVIRTYTDYRILIGTV